MRGKLFFFPCSGCPYEGSWGRKVILPARATQGQPPYSSFSLA